MGTRRHLVAVVLGVALLGSAVACGSGGSDRQGAVGTTRISGATTAVPDELRIVAVPAAELWEPVGGIPRAVDAVPISATELLIGTWDPRGHRPGPYHVYDLDDDRWSPVEVPPLDGQVTVQAHAVEAGAVVAGLSCSEYTEADLEHEPRTCESGYSFQLARFDPSSSDWTLVADLPVADVGASDPTALTLDVLGVHDGRLYAFVEVRGGEQVLVFAVDTTSGEVHGEGRAVADGWFPRCVTGDGYLVGPQYRGVTGGDWSTEDPIEVHRGPVAAWSAARGELSILPVIATTQQRLACHRDGFTIVGPTELGSADARWQTFTSEGAPTGDRPLPATDGAWTDMSSVQIVGAELDQTALVSSITRLGGDRRIVVLPAAAGAPLVYDPPHDDAVVATGVTRMPNGQIFMFASSTGQSVAEDERTRILVAD